MRFLLRVFVFILRMMPVKLIAILGMVFGYIAYPFVTKRRRIVARNLRITIDPNLRPAQLRRLVRRNIVLTCMNFACALKVGIMSDKELLRSVRLIGKEEFEQSGGEKNTGIACIPHAGNWEILARIRPYFTKVERFGSMYRRLRNPALEELVYALRTKHGCEMFSKEAGLRQVIRMTRTGGLIGILSDQAVIEGVHVPYFGKVAGTTPFPAMLHSMCKSRLFAVHTRNTGLGRWDAVLGDEIHLNYQATDQSAADTISINLALENAQKVSILDGFWMHHRWKTTNHFGLQGEEKLAEAALPFVRLPFRIIVALPEQFEEAIICLPALRILAASRYDAELSVICPEEQKPFWRTQSIISHVLSMDSSEQSLREQLNAEEVYANGPFDYAFMWNENKTCLRELQELRPLPISGFTENKLAAEFNHKFTSTHCAPVRHAFRDYFALLEKGHRLDCTQWEQASQPYDDAEKTCWLAPFSTLGSCETEWPREHWKQLVDTLKKEGHHCALLALPQDEQEATSMAEELEIDLKLVPADRLQSMLGANSRLLCVDGLIPQIAALTEAQYIVMMASRLSKRYRPLTPRARILFSHSACHPCYRKNCDSPSPCIREISPAQVMTEWAKLTPLS